jgi:hypothetical protein
MAGVCCDDVSSEQGWQPQGPTRPAKSQSNEHAGGDKCLAVASGHGFDPTRPAIFRQMSKVTWIRLLHPHSIARLSFVTFGTAWDATGQVAFTHENQQPQGNIPPLAGSLLLELLVWSPGTITGCLRVRPRPGSKTKTTLKRVRMVVSAGH